MSVGALVQDRPGGRIRATKSDRLVRYVQIPGPFGPVEIEVRGSKQASDAAKYDAAVKQNFLRGDLKALAPWHGKTIGGVELITASPRSKGSLKRVTSAFSLPRALRRCCMSAVRQCPKCPRRRCFVCGSKKDLQEHHLGGRNHARFSTITLCRSPSRGRFDSYRPSEDQSRFHQRYGGARSARTSGGISFSLFS